MSVIDPITFGELIWPNAYELRWPTHFSAQSIKPLWFNLLLLLHFCRFTLPSGYFFYWRHSPLWRSKHFGGRLFFKNNIILLSL